MFHYFVWVNSFPDTIYQIFEDVYQKYEDAKFSSVDMMVSENSFIDEVVNSAISVYERQRNVDIKWVLTNQIKFTLLINMKK